MRRAAFLCAPCLEIRQLAAKNLRNAESDSSIVQCRNYPRRNVLNTESGIRVGANWSVERKPGSIFQCGRVMEPEEEKSDILPRCRPDEAKRILKMSVDC